jgi:hypothetical protein
MAKVKIFLEPGETQQDAEDSLFKAMQHHNTGEVHSSHSFQDPAMVAVSQKMEKIHSEIYQDMLNEIFQELDKEYSANGNE